MNKKCCIYNNIFRISFYLDCINYRSHSINNGSSVFRSALGKQIYNDYIVPGCNNQIKLDEEIKKNITVKVCKKQFDTSLFQEAENYVTKFLIINFAQPFIESHYHSEVLPISRWFNEYVTFPKFVQDAIKDKINSIYCRRVREKYTEVNPSQSIIDPSISENPSYRLADPTLINGDNSRSVQIVGQSLSNRRSSRFEHMLPDVTSPSISKIRRVAGQLDSTKLSGISKHSFREVPVDRIPQYYFQTNPNRNSVRYGSDSVITNTTRQNIPK